MKSSICGTSYAQPAAAKSTSAGMSHVKAGLQVVYHQQLLRRKPKPAHYLLQRPRIWLAALGRLLPAEHQIRLRQAVFRVVAADVLVEGVRYDADVPALGLVTAHKLVHAGVRAGDVRATYFFQNPFSSQLRGPPSRFPSGPPPLSRGPIFLGYLPRVWCPPGWGAAAPPPARGGGGGGGGGGGAAVPEDGVGVSLPPLFFIFFFFLFFIF